MDTKRLIKICAVICGLSGVVILIWVFYPIISYQFNAPTLMSFLSPIPDTSVSSNTNTDYTKASNWFPQVKTVSFKSQDSQAPNSYKISIPRIGINKAIVAIGGEDLSQS